MMIEMLCNAKLLTSMMVVIALASAGCDHGGKDGGGSKWFDKLAKGKDSTSAKSVEPLKVGKSSKVKSSRGLSPLKPLKVTPARGPTAIKPLKVQPTRAPTPLKPLELKKTRVQPNDSKNWFDLTSKKSQVTLGQPPAAKPKNLWEWLAGNPKIDQQPAQKSDSWFHSWFKAGKSQR